MLVRSMLVVQCKDVSFCRGDTFVFILSTAENADSQPLPPVSAHWFLSNRQTSFPYSLYPICSPLTLVFLLLFVVRPESTSNKYSPKITSPTVLLSTGLHFAEREGSLHIVPFSYSFLNWLFAFNTHQALLLHLLQLVLMSSTAIGTLLVFLTSPRKHNQLVWWCTHATHMILLTTASWQRGWYKRWWLNSPSMIASK